MRFKHGDHEYEIEFKRDYREIESFDRDGQLVRKMSKYPYTTVVLSRLIPGTRNSELVRTATAGAHYKDRFTLEKGRLYTLRLISKTLNKELKAAMWKAYMERGTTKVASRGGVK